MVGFRCATRGLAPCRATVWLTIWIPQWRWSHFGRWYSVWWSQPNRRWGSTYPWRWYCSGSVCLRNWWYAWFGWELAIKYPSYFWSYMCNYIISQEYAVRYLGWHRYFFLHLVIIVSMLHWFSILNCYIINKT